jgi:predicted enzyme related to lactoylglutathione lyase
MKAEKYHLGLLKIPVKDIEKSAQFYEKNLRFQLDFLAPEFGWAQMKAGEISLALYVPGMGGGDRQIGGSVDFHLNLAGEDFDEMAKNMEEAGQLSDDMIHTGADGTTYIDILDLDENIIKVFRRN